MPEREESTAAKSTGSPIRFSVLHDSDTEMGTVMLRRRRSPALERDVYEMTVDGKLMMSSAVADSERALSERALALLPDKELKVLIGGLGFGFTAQQALADSRAREVTVVERLGLVIEWHRAGLLPWSGAFFADPRLKVYQGDFFARLAGGTQSRYDAVLIDIDDSPSLLWHGSHAAFYESAGLEAMRDCLAPGGVFALWCAVHPGAEFVALADAVFEHMQLAEIEFENPCLRQPDINYILLATALS